MNNDGLVDSLGDALLQLGEYLPNLATAAAVLLVGWAVASVLRTASQRLAHILDQATHRFSRAAGAEPSTTPPAWGRMVGGTVFWLSILIAIALATQALGIETFSNWLDRMSGYLPALLSGVLIVLAGFLLSTLARDLVTATVPADERQRLLLGRLAQAIILVTATVIGADQIGMNVTFLTTIAAVLLAAIVGGVALAVSLGARAFVANLISAQTLRETYQIGQTIRIAGHEGRVIEITPTAMILETTDGRVNLPAKLFSEQPTVLLKPGNGDGQG